MRLHDLGDQQVNAFAMCEQWSDGRPAVTYSSTQPPSQRAPAVEVLNRNGTRGLTCLRVLHGTKTRRCVACSKRCACMVKKRVNVSKDAEFRSERHFFQVVHPYSQMHVESTGNALMRLPADYELRRWDRTSLKR